MFNSNTNFHKHHDIWITFWKEALIAIVNRKDLGAKEEEDVICRVNRGKSYKSITRRRPDFEKPYPLGTDTEATILTC